MRFLAIMLFVGLVACGKEADQRSAQSVAKPTAASAVAGSMMAGKPGPVNAAMIPVPADKRQLERMLAMGYTVHEDHMHAPGVKECPFNMGGSVVQ